MDDFVGVVKSKKDFEKLMEYLKGSGFPALRRTISRMKFCSVDEKTTVMEIARRILEDPGLSTRLLKVANSPVFNPGLYRVRTVTRAIVMLGIRNVMSIVRTIAFLEDVVSIKEMAKVVEKIVMALKKAELAKRLAETTMDLLPEEVFLGALMYDIGEMIYAAFVDPSIDDQISKIAREKKISKQVVQRKVLGFAPEDITATLNKEWKVSEVIDDIFSPGKKSQKSKIVLCAGKIVDLLESNDQEAPTRLQSLLKNMSSELKLPLKSMVECIKNAKEDFQRLEKVYESDLRKLKKRSQRDQTEKDQELPVSAESIDKIQPIKPDSLYRIFEILNDIISMMFKGFSDPHLLFSLVMEAIYSGLDMDVAMFGLLSTDKKYFQIRHNLVKPGVNNVKIPETISFKNPRMNLFIDLLNLDSPLWINENSPPELLAKANSIPASGVVHIPCFLMPVRPKNKTIGFIYADCRSRNELVNENSFMVFTMLGQLATIGLSFLVTESQ